MGCISRFLFGKHRTDVFVDPPLVTAGPAAAEIPPEILGRPVLAPPMRVVDERDLGEVPAWMTEATAELPRRDVLVGREVERYGRLSYANGYAAAARAADVEGLRVELRHALSGPDVAPDGWSNEGRENAERVLEVLRRRGILPDGP